MASVHSSGIHVDPPAYVWHEPNTVIHIPLWPLTDTVLLPNCSLPLKGDEDMLEYGKAFRVNYHEEHAGEHEGRGIFGQPTGEVPQEETQPLLATPPPEFHSDPNADVLATPAFATVDASSPTVTALPGEPDSEFYPTLGVISVKVDEDGNLVYASVGVTVEITGCALLSHCRLGIIVKGKQLFHLTKTEKIRNMLWGTIVIFQDSPCRSLSDTVSSVGCSVPKWARTKYDPFVLLEQVKTAAHGVINVPKIPDNPEEASFWILSELVMTDEARQEFLEMPTPLRLQRLVQELDSYSTVCCAGCKTELADTNEMFCMSNDSLQNSFVNKHGFVHDTITFRNLCLVPLIWGSPTTKDSWYPGYSWTITYCPVCMNHLGWLFKRTRDQDPKFFWGLSRRSLSRIQKKESQR